jgi:hypothetical protein
VLGEAALDVAAREMQVAAQEMDAGAHFHEPVLLSRSLSAVQIGEGAVEIVGDPFYRGQSEPRRSPCAIVSSKLERPLVGDPRFGHRTEVVEDLAVQARERKSGGGKGGKRETALGQPARALVVVIRGLGARGLEIGVRRLGILGPIEVLGA